MLAVAGAGMNPFASMPFVFGIVMFAAAPFRGPLPQFYGALPRKLCLLLIAAALWDAALGVRWHTKPPEFHGSMSAFTEAVHLMQDDTRSHGRSVARFATAHVAAFEVYMVRNVLIYEFHGVPKDGGVLTPDGILFRTDLGRQLTASTLLNWKEDIPGATDEEKLRWIVDTANGKLDYFFFPDERSVAHLAKWESYNYINRRVGEIKRRVLATGRWERLGPPLKIRRGEVIELYTKKDSGRREDPANRR